MSISFSVKNGNPNMALVMISSWIYNYLHVESVTITTKVVSYIYQVINVGLGLWQYVSYIVAVVVNPTSI